MLIHHLGISEPFSRCSGKKGLKKYIIEKPGSKKEPSKIIGLVPPIHHLKVPAPEDKECQGKNQEGVYEEIQSPGAIAYCFHFAKISKEGRES